MKAPIKLAIIGFSMLAISSCKNKKDLDDKADLVEEVSEIGILNTSDIHFNEAITALESNDHSNSAMHLDKGIDALEDEGADLKDSARSTFEASVAQLKAISKALKSDRKIEVDKLQEAMANAEIAVGHEYLISDDIYVLTEPKKADDHIVRKAFDRNMKNLEKTTSELDKNKSKDGDGSGQKLYDEGKQLEKQLDEVMAKIKNHVERTNVHMKKYHPEHHFPIIYTFE